MILALLGALTIGLTSGPVPVSVSVEWEISYPRTGAVDPYISPSWQLTFEPREFEQCWEARASVDGGPWSEWGGFCGAMPYPGDSTFNCIVNTQDFSAVQTHFGESCP